MQQEHREIRTLLHQLPRNGSQIGWVAGFRQHQHPPIGMKSVLNEKIDQNIAFDNQNVFHAVVVDVRLGPLRWRLIQGWLGQQPGTFAQLSLYLPRFQTAIKKSPFDRRPDEIAGDRQNDRQNDPAGEQAQCGRIGSIFILQDEGDCHGDRNQSDQDEFPPRTTHTAAERSIQLVLSKPLCALLAG